MSVVFLWDGMIVGECLEIVMVMVNVDLVVENVYIKYLELCVCV